MFILKIIRLGLTYGVRSSQLASLGKPTLATELTHGLGYNIEPNGSISDENTALLRKDLSFFEEIFDIAGANGSDTSLVLLSR